MMKSKKWLAGAVAFAGIVLVALFVFSSTSRRPGLTRANFARIDVGMSYKDVAHLLGQDADQVWLYPCQWSNDEGVMIYINFNEEKRVVNKIWDSPEETWIEKIVRQVSWR